LDVAVKALDHVKRGQSAIDEAFNAEDDDARLAWTSVAEECFHAAELVLKLADATNSDRQYDPNKER
jgi:hypothetical protein